MKQFKTLTMLSAAVLMGFAAPSFAQNTDMIKDKAIDMAKDKVKNKATDMATEKAGDMGGTVAGKGVDMGADMMKGKSMKDAAKGAVMDSGKSTVKSDSGLMGTVLGSSAGTDMAKDAVGSMSTDEKMKAGKIMLKGGSAKEAATAVAKDRAKDKMMNTAKGMLTKEMSRGTASTMETAPIIETAPAPTAVMVNCPAGTTAQPNGTCMITGDYDGGN